MLDLHLKSRHALSMTSIVFFRALMDKRQVDILVYVQYRTSIFNRLTKWSQFK